MAFFNGKKNLKRLVFQNHEISGFDVKEKSGLYSITSARIQSVFMIENVPRLKAEAIITRKTVYRSKVHVFFYRFWASYISLQA